MESHKQAQHEQVRDAALISDQNLPVFVYSGFRASSTWFWSKLREDEHSWAYYEPFHEGHASLGLENVLAQRPEAWRSHHPSDAPYMIEYVPLLGIQPGVPFFPLESAPGDRFFGSQGIDGALDPDVECYARSLIDVARQRERTPVLADTRIMGRSTGFRRAFGGHHVLLIRNLYQQWNSYLGQANFGNYYFLETLFNTLNLSKKDEYLNFLINIFPISSKSSLNEWVKVDNIDRVFCYFVGFHIYTILKTRRNSDIVIDINRLARRGADYQHEISGQIAGLTGLHVDLSDARENIDFPLHPVQCRRECEAMIRAMAEKALMVTLAEQSEGAFVEALLDNLWDEQERFAMYTGGVSELLKKQGDAESVTQGKVASAERQLADKERALEDLANCLSIEEQRTANLTIEIESTRHSLDEMRKEAEAFRSGETELHRRLTELTDKVTATGAAMDSALSDLDKERNALTDILQELGNANDRVVTSEASLAEMRGERDILANRLRQRDEEVAQVWDDLKQAHTALAQAEGELRMQHDAREKLAGATSALAALRQQMEGAEAVAEEMAANQFHQIEELRSKQAELIAIAARQESSLAGMAKQIRTQEAAEVEHQRNSHRLISELERRDAIVDQQRVDLAWLRDLTVTVQKRSWWQFLLPPTYARRRLRKHMTKLGLFDSDLYLELYPDVAASGMCPIDHFLRHGLEEGRHRPIPLHARAVVDNSAS